MDHGGEVAHDRGGGLVILLLQLVALVLDVILERAHLLGELVLEILALVGRHQHALLVEFVLEPLGLGLFALKSRLRALGLDADVGLARACRCCIR